jgi:hypothetical protein
LVSKTYQTLDNIFLSLVDISTRRKLAFPLLVSSVELPFFLGVDPRNRGLLALLLYIFMVRLWLKCSVLNLQSNYQTLPWFERLSWREPIQWQTVSSKWKTSSMLRRCFWSDRKKRSSCRDVWKNKQPMTKQELSEYTTAIC